MLIDWLYRITLEISLLIGLVLLLRPAVRRYLGARAAYWLWFVPLLRILLPQRPARPTTLLEVVAMPGGQLDIGILSNPDILVVSPTVPVIPIWIAGMSIWFSFRFVSAIRFRRYLRANAGPCTPPAEAIESLPSRLRKLDGRYFSCTLPGAPFLTGFLRPSIYLPTDFCDRFGEREQRCILHHELTHFQRRDLWVQAAWEFLRGVFWFNPIVHIGAFALRDDQEFACDQTVLASCNRDERFHYGRALLIGAGPYLTPPTLTFFGNTKERILMIEKHKTSKPRTLAGLTLCLFVGALALTKAPMSLAQSRLGDPITLNFQEIPIERVVGLFAEFAEMEVVGIEQIEGPVVTIRVFDVPARDALMQLLNCVGHTFQSNGQSLEIVPLQSSSDVSFECNDVEFPEEQTV
jgi:beta-lactamase regulating signal transducer with metallopeptidase domain